ncbi:DinB family protein [Streptomyces avicenniae]|uniref:DinB family protein n=1 Tax=Streptomyces avicenniae TaxID=500153 RepID=UPI00069BF9CE|nr:DinB family protein [Streptomyces avicenniae]
MTDQTWNVLLRDQMTWHWTHQLRPRLDGLTDDEYLWEPTPDCWSVHPGGSWAGAMTLDTERTVSWPPPFTTVAWRLGHVIADVFAARNASHFGRAPVDRATFPFAATAAGALAQLDEEYATWTAGVESLDEAGLARPCGEAEGPYADYPLAALVLHINREVIHHMAEVCMLRDLYLHKQLNSHRQTRQEAS